MPGCKLQVGLVSFGAGCGLPQTPGVYTDLRQYRPWIAATILVGRLTAADVHATKMRHAPNAQCFSMRGKPNAAKDPAADTLRLLSPLH